MINNEIKDSLNGLSYECESFTLSNDKLRWTINYAQPRIYLSQLNRHVKERLRQQIYQHVFHIHLMAMKNSKIHFVLLINHDRWLTS